MKKKGFHINSKGHLGKMTYNEADQLFAARKLLNLTYYTTQLMVLV